MEITDIGFSDSTALLCLTDFFTAPGNKNSGGNWFAPDGTRVNSNDVMGLLRNRGPMQVRLFRNQSETKPVVEGMYHCSVMDAAGKNQTLHVGLYGYGQGMFLIKEYISCDKF